ncbi:hypothetical protein SARC_01149 [Sphaeroforma arctica JP610]|uniref:THAP-type domain-containing protein n=1 Tax=Sphaeroforma arctica JP610 TaxID=667725 RepID=A0A0L0GCU5_9EUKA|nr:hypothetical protein SARC_01149 [Sphaeroforma arctica JP610]KNC86729.1 hypothetical protein SARC_01149 [Sphaeroforma arctica JP610]|eukprot:XP_014160631.1 hypothetical protein SARC_01149 [Sphaeroforma arctica JP610]
MGVKVCQVASCESATRERDGVTYWMFPKVTSDARGPERQVQREEWMVRCYRTFNPKYRRNKLLKTSEQVKEEHWAKKTLYMCSRHFEEEFKYIDSTGAVRKHPGALPTLHLRREGDYVQIPFEVQVKLKLFERDNEVGGDSKKRLSDIQQEADSIGGLLTLGGALPQVSSNSKANSNRITNGTNNKRQKVFDSAEHDHIYDFHQLYSNFDHWFAGEIQLAKRWQKGRCKSGEFISLYRVTNKQTAVSVLEYINIDKELTLMHTFPKSVHMADAILSSLQYETEKVCLVKRWTVLRATMTSLS